MSNPNLSPDEVHVLLEMVINAPLGSFANAMQRQPLINKFIDLRNQAHTGARVDALSVEEAIAVDKIRRRRAAESTEK